MRQIVKAYRPAAASQTYYVHGTYCTSSSAVQLRQSLRQRHRAFVDAIRTSYFVQSRTINLPFSSPSNLLRHRAWMKLQKKKPGAGCPHWP